MDSYNAKNLGDMMGRFFSIPSGLCAIYLMVFEFFFLKRFIIGGFLGMVDVDGFLGDRSHFPSTHKKVHIICDGFVPRFVRPLARAQTGTTKRTPLRIKSLFYTFFQARSWIFCVAQKGLRRCCV